MPQYEPERERHILSELKERFREVASTANKLETELRNIGKFLRSEGVTQDLTEEEKQALGRMIREAHRIAEKAETATREETL
jgi:hypothetical protein